MAAKRKTGKTGKTTVKAAGKAARKGAAKPRSAASPKGAKGGRAAQATQAAKAGPSAGKGTRKPAAKSPAGKGTRKQAAKSPAGKGEAGARRAVPARAAAPGKPNGPRPSEVKGQSVESYLARVGGWQSDVLRAVHDLILAAAPDAVHGLKWGMPFYEVDGPVLFTRAAKSHVSVGFWQGTSLGAPKGLLEGTSRLQHLKLRQGERLPSILPDLIRKAIALNRA